MRRVGAVTACGENPTQARRSSCCQRERDSRSVIAMSENTPENPQDQQPHGADPLEAQTPEAEASTDDVAAADAEPAEREESFSAAAIVNAPPTTEIDEEQPPTRTYEQPPVSSASASPTSRAGQDIPAAPEHNPEAP